MSKISVIVPVYKVEKYLKRCVDSILNQTFTDFDLILVDDGSPDNCPALCDEYAKQDTRINVIHKSNGGLSDARNAGIDWAFANSDSKFLTFIDSDDWVHEKYLELLYNAIIATNAGVSICAYQMTNGEDVPIIFDRDPFILEKTESFFCEEPVTAIIACAKLYKKEDFASLRYPVGRLHEDEFTTYKILFKYSQVVFVPYPLYAYYQNAKGIMGSSWSSVSEDAFVALEEQISFFMKNNYMQAIRRSIRMYSWLFCRLKHKQNKNGEKEIRRVVQKYIKYLNPDDPRDEFVLFKIRPCRMKIYVRWRALKGKIKKLFRKKSN